MHKVDRNQRDIINAALQLGCYNVDLSGVGFGCPDQLFRMPDGVLVLVEIKSKNGVLTPAQVKFHSRWPDPIPVIRSVEEMIKLVEEHR